ncbi:hypothetical protein ABK040_000648 [Willaertia magna]
MKNTIFLAVLFSLISFLTFQAYSQQLVQLTPGRIITYPVDRNISNLYVDLKPSESIQFVFIPLGSEDVAVYSKLSSLPTFANFDNRHTVKGNTAYEFTVSNSKNVNDRFYIGLQKDTVNNQTPIGVRITTRRVSISPVKDTLTPASVIAISIIAAIAGLCLLVTLVTFTLYCCGVLTCCSSKRDKQDSYMLVGEYPRTPTKV